MDKKETCQPNDVSTTLSNPLEHDTIQQQTSGNNHSLPSPLYMVQESAYNVTQTDTPQKSNHAEANILPTELDNHPVPEPVFTLDLDIETSCPDLSVNENNIPIDIVINCHYCQVASFSGSGWLRFSFLRWKSFLG